jgi:hypothetical protein
VKPALLVTLLLATVGSSPGSCGGTRPYEPCAGRVCGDLCDPCPPGSNCAASPHLTACDADAHCVVAGTGRACSDPCAGKVCGEVCDPCGGSGPCPTEVTWVCDGARSCLPLGAGAVGCQDCAGLACGTACHVQLCMPFGCTAIDAPGACDTSGFCITEPSAPICAP